MKSTKNKLKIFPCIILIALTFFVSSCKTVGLVAAVGGIVGELAGIEGSAEMAMSIFDGCAGPVLSLANFRAMCVAISSLTSMAMHRSNSDSMSSRINGEFLTVSR